MKLIELYVRNFRSIEELTFAIRDIKGTQTYTLIGINESGKSSFLKAVSAILNEEEIVFPRDFFNAGLPVSAGLIYEILPEEYEELKKDLAKLNFDEELLSCVSVKQVIIGSGFEATQGATKRSFEQISFGQSIFPEYTLLDDKPIKKDPKDTTQAKFDLQEFFRSHLPNYFRKLAHHIVFWKSDSKYLINERINLTNFAASPENTSIPLVNCFALAGVSNETIKDQVTKLQDNPAETNNVQERLGECVTTHIKKVWPDNPVKIKFQINHPWLSFLVEDDKVKFNAKTTDQRSDGFRQFVSFLLTISAESAINKLSNTLLLIDEPESHLHPKAQEYLMDELIKITKNHDNNIVFFATHSNHMIDKNCIERCYRVSKESNEKTKFAKIELEKTSYAEVNYEVFGIAGTDYHNELYGYIEAEDKDRLTGLDATKEWIKVKNDGSKESPKKVSLSEYIRHSIHHPENTQNNKFTDDELKESIEKLRELRKALM